MTSILLWNLVFKIELYLMKQIHKNTDRVVSGFILTKVLLRNPEFEIKTDTREYRKLHLKRYGSSGVNKGGYWGYLPPPRILGLNPPPRILGVITPEHTFRP